MSDDILGQRMLPFKLGVTKETITSRSGLAIFYEVALACGLVARIRQCLPVPCSNRGIAPEGYIMPLLLMLIGGGRTMEHIREIAQDIGLRRLCRLRRIPGADAIGKWLKSPRRLPGMRRINEYLCRLIVAKSKHTDFTLDTDATLIETGKKTAQVCYKGFPAFAPLLSFLAELGLCVVSEFRNGAVPAGVGIVEQLSYVHKLLTSLGKRLRYFRSDSAGYQAAVINTCQRLGVKFTITADQDAAVKTIIKEVAHQREWKPLFDQEGKRTDREYTAAVHCMSKTEAFLLIIQRWLNPKPDLFTSDPYCYYVIATNDFEHPLSELIWFHNARGNAENYHKELKSGLGMDYVPCQSLEANAVWFEIGILAYNLTVGVKRLLLGGEWVTKTVATLRWELIFIAGKVVRHGRNLWLRVAAPYYELLKTIREQISLLLTPT